MQKIFFLLLATIIFGLGCGKESPDLFQLKDRYQLTSVIADAPLDLNFDGAQNLDLTEEISALKGINLIIDTSLH